MMNINKTILTLIILVALIQLPTSVAFGDNTEGLSKGQTIYVPAYSHIYSGNRDNPFNLAITLSIRNTDLNHTIILTSTKYYDTEGKLLKQFAPKPTVLNPLETMRFTIQEKDESGGSGANFIVTWESDRPVNAPIVESIMIGTEGQQGISFTSRGKVIVDSDE